MTILTLRELEFLASLSTGWKGLYRSELSRLLKEDDSRCDRRHAANSIIRISAAHSRHSHQNSTNVKT
jgi:hypothetical protein